jgi:cytochrome c oxidase subunit II
VQKWWSFLFGGVMAATVVLWVVAPFVGWWLPENVSTYGGKVDGLFYLILAITGFFFILTEALLVYFLYTYAGGPGRRDHVFGHHYAEDKVLWTAFFKRIARPITAVIHDQHRLELTWTLVPGVILLFIAIVQIGAWEDIKYQSRMPKPGQQTQQMDVSARQFEWRVRYPSAERMLEWDKSPDLANDFANSPHEDDLWLVNEVHVWKQNKVLVHLRTKDVIHSFYFPNLRLKQDALPGKTIPVWFEVTEGNTVKQEGRWVDGGGIKPNGEPNDPRLVWELACAELCGWGHYKMTGRLYVHDTREDFMNWLRSARQRQDQTEPSPEPATITAAR